MAIPVVYNVRSIRVRWAAALVAVLGIAGTVAVFVAMLALAHGFEATLESSGSESNAIVRRAGSSSEMDSALDLEAVRVVEAAPGVARLGEGALATAEVVVIAPFPLAGSGTDANVQVRGVSGRPLEVHDRVKVVSGRFFRPGLAELVVGRNAATAYTGLGLGQTVSFGGGAWTVVGLFDAGGSAFDSEAWCDADILNQVYQRPPGIFQSATVRLVSPAALSRFKDALTADPRLSVQVDRETEYYAKQSRNVATMIYVLGSLVALVMGLGAVFGALNTMYAAVADRAKEIATLRAIGFGETSVVLAFVVESVLVSLAGGLLGCLVALPLNGVTTGTMNWSTFSHLAFAFRVTPALLLAGLGFALAMGLVGGLPPAVRAARLPVTVALREL